MKRGEGSPQELAGLVDELDPDVVSVEELTPGLADELDAAGIGDALPHQRLEPGQGPIGTGLYSRYRLGAPLDEVRSGYAVLVSAMVEAPGGQPVEISSIHTAPPTAAGWSHDLEGISPAPTDGRAVLMGDFNSTIDHAPFRGVLDRGWADAAATVGSGLVPTWPEGRRIPPLYAIDHVLVGDAIGVRSFSAHEIAGTDHRAVFAELQVPGG
jgi:endonuclease/exonuclease/phosphatase family metal-dependent hydrolase